MMKIRTFVCAVVLGHFLPFGYNLHAASSQHCSAPSGILSPPSHNIGYSICDQVCVAVEYVFERTDAEFMKRALYWITTSGLELSERCGGYVCDETGRHIASKGTTL